jgi:hypothetical protein
MRGIVVCRDLTAVGQAVRQSPASFDPVMARARAVPVDGTGWRGATGPRGRGVGYAR